jgi:hypothetical protein
MKLLSKLLRCVWVLTLLIAVSIALQGFASTPALNDTGCDARAQLTIVYDGVSFSAISYDCPTSTPAHEGCNGSGETSATLSKFVELLAAETTAPLTSLAERPPIVLGEEFARHYGTVILPTKPETPRHKVKVESGVKYAQNNAVKGRSFESLSAQNGFLSEWEKSVADTRIHRTKRRQVGKVFEEVERPALRLLPASGL